MGNYPGLSFPPEISKRNTNESTQRIAIARNAVHDFVTARAASIPTTTTAMTAIMAYRAGERFMDDILDVPLCDVKAIKVVAELFT